MCFFYWGVGGSYLRNHPIVASKHQHGTAPELVLKEYVKQQQQSVKVKKKHAAEAQGEKMWLAVFTNIVIWFVCFLVLIMDSDFKGNKLHKSEQDRKERERASL